MKALELAGLQDKYARFMKIKKKLTKGQDILQEDRREWSRILLKVKKKKLNHLRSDKQEVLVLALDLLDYPLDYRFLRIRHKFDSLLNVLK